MFRKTTSFWNLRALRLVANILRLIFPPPPREQNESRTITKDREKRGIVGVINIYLPALEIRAILCGIASLHLSV